MPGRQLKDQSRERVTPAPQVTAAGAALVLIDRQGRILGDSGWQERFGDPAPEALPARIDGSDPLLEAVAEAAEQARRTNATTRRLAEVSLDRHRYYSISAGPLHGSGADRDVAVLVLEITDLFRAGPAEGESIRQLGHDLRTPLASMSGAVEMLQMGRLGPLQPEQTRLVGMLQQGIDLMLSLIDGATAPYRAAAQAAGPGPAAISGGDSRA